MLDGLMGYIDLCVFLSSSGKLMGLVPGAPWANAQLPTTVTNAIDPTLHPETLPLFYMMSSIKQNITRYIVHGTNFWLLY